MQIATPPPAQAAQTEHDEARRQMWRQERAFRVGAILSRSGFLLALVATFVNFHYAHLFVVYADLILVLGCFLGIYFSHQKREFFWWPLYVGYWISISVTLFDTGGIGSPFAGMFFALLFVGGLVVQTRFSVQTMLAFVVLNLAGWAGLELLDPLHSASAQPLPFIFSLNCICLSAVGICIYGFLKTEHDLSHEFNERYHELFSAREELSREEAANAAKTSFLANVSHELRTPIGAIMGFAELIQDPEATDTEKLDYAETIRRNGEQLTRLVDDLLDLTKLEAGRIELESLEFRPARLICDVIALLNVHAEKKGLTLSANYASPVPDWIRSDPTRIKQILLNLVGNALKFTEHGSVHLSVRYEAAGGPRSESPAGSDGDSNRALENEPHEATLIIEVRDTGRGLSPRERSKLFQPFGQADVSMSRRYGGTGLGLSLSRRLARLLSGDLGISFSELGIGSIFRLSISVGTVRGSVVARSLEEGLGKPKVLKATAATRTLQGFNVLVVDDAADNRQLIRKYLETAGAHVSDAASGKEAIRMVRATSVDLVLMDIQMPGMDGLHATRLLRRGKFERTIIALTAHAMEQDRDRCLEAGCNSYLTKPIARAELVNTVATFLNVKSTNVSSDATVVAALRPSQPDSPRISL